MINSYLVALALLATLLLLFPVADLGGVGDLEGCLEELGVESLDLAEVGVSDLRLASSTYLGFVIGLRLTDNCCSSEAMARAVLAL